MHKVKCPYCEFENEIDLTATDTEQDAVNEKQCAICQKFFVFYTNVELSFDAVKLEDSEND